MAFETFPSSNISSQMVAQATEAAGAPEKQAEQKAEQQKAEEQHSGLLTDIFGDRKERTLAGCAIGAVRDVFSGNLTEEEKVKRAEGNDFVATIAADTAAMMTKKAAIGGLVRATMLADTKGDARDFALGFAKDGLEGVGLNYIGKMAQPGSRAFEFAGSRLGTGLKQEIGLNAGSGALFGALKAGADPTAWRDKNGHFSFESGLNNLTDWKKMSTATISGAVINVPAGMLGTRLAKSSTISIINRTGSESLGMVTGGVLSGGGSGAVFGGLDAVIHGKSLGEIGKSTFDGMLIGAGTGGVMSGFHAFGPGKQSNLQAQMQERLQPKGQEKTPVGRTASTQEPIASGQEKISLVSKEALATESQLEVISSASREKIKNGIDELSPLQEHRMSQAHDSVAYTREPKLGVVDLNRQLTLEPQGEIKLRRVKIDPDMPAAFEDEAAFLKFTEEHTEATRVYKIEGTKTKITVPEVYAKKLDQIRELRMWAEIDAPSFDNLPATTRRVVQKEIQEGRMDLAEVIFGEKAANIAKIVKARVTLNTNPEMRRALPEDFIQDIKALPDPSLVKELVLLDEPFYMNGYRQSKVNPDGVVPRPAAATAGRDGVITFYEQLNTRDKGATTGGTLSEFLNHEWSHLVKFNFPEHSVLFNQAAEIETGFYVRDYAKRQYPDHTDLQHHENWAVHMGEELMATDADRFFITAHNAPIRTTLMAKAWLESLIPRTTETVVHPAEFQARIDKIPAYKANREMQVARLKYVAEEIVPVAREKLLGIIAEGPLADRLRAAQILGRIGDAADVPVAQQILKTAGDTGLKKALFNSIVNISNSSLDARLGFLIENARPGSATREEALAALSGFRHPEARDYYDALRLSESNSDTIQLMNVIERTPVTGAKKIAFENLVKVTSQSEYANDFLSNYLVKLLRTQPDIRVEVLKEALKHPSMELELEAARLQRSHDRVVAQRAREAVKEFQTARQLETYKTWLQSANEQYKYNAIQELGWMNDNRAIPVLLKVVAGSNPKWAKEAVGALSHYNPNMIHAAANQMQRDGMNVRWGDILHQMRLSNQ